MVLVMLKLMVSIWYRILRLKLILSWCVMCVMKKEKCVGNFFLFFFGSVTDYMLDEKKYTRKKLRVSEFWTTHAVFWPVRGTGTNIMVGDPFCVTTTRPRWTTFFFSGKAYHVPEIKKIFQNAYKRRICLQKKKNTFHITLHYPQIATFMVHTYVVLNHVRHISDFLRLLQRPIYSNGHYYKIARLYIWVFLLTVNRFSRVIEWCLLLYEWTCRGLNPTRRMSWWFYKYTFDMLSIGDFLVEVMKPNTSSLLHPDW